MIGRALLAGILGLVGCGGQATLDQPNPPPDWPKANDGNPAAAVEAPAAEATPAEAPPTEGAGAADTDAGEPAPDAPPP